MAEKPDNQSSQLLDEVSHELRTPLNAVLGMLELSLDEPLSDGLRDYLATAYRSARRLLAVLDDVIDLAHARRGNLELARVPFDFRRTVDMAIATLQVEASARGLDVKTRVHPDVPDYLQGDARRLQKLVANLLECAMKTTAASTVHVEVAVASRADQTFELALGITDDALGQSDWPQFAEPAEVDGDRGAEYPGGQLALAISQQWTEHMGGRLWVDPDHPSRLYCTVRLAPAGQSEVSRHFDAVAEATQGAGPKPGELASSPLHVLVVDDTRANQRVVKAMLARRGHDVQVADNGRQAVDRVRQQMFDVVLMDAQMPIMDGLEAARSIRKLDDRKHAQTPIIAMTALVMQSDRRRCLAAGMDDYLSKPISATALIASVEFYGNARNIAAPETALTRLGGDEALLCEMIRLFQEDAPSLLERAHASLRNDDIEGVLRAAHSLRSLAANFDAVPTVEAALTIEQLASAGDLAALPPALKQLESELARLQRTLEVHELRRS